MVPGHIFLTDGKLIVRNARLDDAQMISDYFVTNKAFLKPWEPERDEAFYEKFTWAQRLIKLDELHKMELGFYLIIIDLASNQMVGTISFSQLSRFPIHTCNVGYSLSETAVGKGIMTRALKLACEYMFEVQNLHRIQAAYMPRNHRSEAVLKRVGFEKEGYARQYLLINGIWEDHVLNALINPGWQQK